MAQVDEVRHLEIRRRWFVLFGLRFDEDGSTPRRRLVPREKAFLFHKQKEADFLMMTTRRLQPAVAPTRSRFGNYHAFRAMCARRYGQRGISAEIQAHPGEEG